MLIYSNPPYLVTPALWFTLRTVGRWGPRQGFNRFTKKIPTPKAQTMKDVNSIYGLKPIYNTFYIYVNSSFVALILMYELCFRGLSA